MKANFHLNKKSTLALIAILIGISALLTIVASISTTTDLAQLSVLAQSNYDYSAVAPNSTAQDQYIQFNAGIWFALSADSATSLSVDVIMQSEVAEYTDLVHWSTEKLSIRGVAISQNIAEAHNLSAGDMIYSKHVVDGAVCGYRIESIIPAVTGVRVSENSGYNTGLVIMGYDDQYVENITHTSLIFSQEPLEMLAEKCSGTPERIVYREDEIKDVVMHILPYILIYATLSIFCMLGLVYFLSRMIEPNFRRLAMIGYAQQSLNTAYNLLVLGAGGTVVAITFLISLVAFSIQGVHFVCVIPAVLGAFAEIIVLYVSSTTTKRRLWRK